MEVSALNIVLGGRSSLDARVRRCSRFTSSSRTASRHDGYDSWQVPSPHGTGYRESLQGPLKSDLTQWLINGNPYSFDEWPSAQRPRS